MTRRLRQIVLILGDVILGFLALVLTIRIGFWNNFSWGILQQHLLPFSILYFFWFLLLYIFGLYDLNLIRPKLELLAKTGECLLTCLIIGAIFFYLMPLFGITPKTNLLINILIFAALIAGWRRTFYSLFSSLFLRNVGFLGKGPLSKKLVKEIESQPQLGYKFVGFLNPKKPLLGQLKREGVNSQTKNFGARVNILIIALDLTRNQKLTRDLYECLPLKINFVNMAQAYEILLQKIPIDFINQSWFLENLRTGEKKIYENLKRIGDITLAFFFLLLGSPLLLLIALLIKAEDKGPVFYKQKRIGKDRRVFWLWKFRSMKVKAEKDGARWAEKNDDRITRIGRILRRLHFDETPQMLNVLNGDISLVGPRPERPEFVKELEKEIPHYHLRHLIKPGFTGWAQIKFRYARTLIDSHEKFQYDLYYIKNQSFFLDLGALLKTFQLLFRKE